jgi:hypothetical protein
MKSKTQQRSVAVALAVLLTGCVQNPLGPTVQVMPGRGKTFEVFQADNNACKQFAGQQVAGQADQANQRAAATGLLSAALGAGVGGALGGGNGAAVGAAAGSTIGTGIGANDSANAQLGIQQQYDAAFSQCMYAKGEAVPGFAPLSPPPISGPVATADPFVRSVQRELVRVGELSGGADGMMGSHTSSAISRFEAANGLPVDGNVSPRLLASLRATPSPTLTAAAPAWVAPVGSTAAPTNSPPASGGGWVQPVVAQ